MIYEDSQRILFFEILICTAFLSELFVELLPLHFQALCWTVFHGKPIKHKIQMVLLEELQDRSRGFSRFRF